MAKDSSYLASSFDTENTGGLLTGFLAEEEVLDRRALWQLGSWGAASVGAVVLAVYANQSSIGWRRDLLAATDLSRQAQQLQTVAKESQNQTRRLASDIETLNRDRDRLYARITVLEQGLDSVTGAIARQNAAAAPAVPTPSAAAETQPAAQNPSLAPVPAAVATTSAAAAEKSPGAAPAVAPAVATVAPAAPETAKVPAASPATPLIVSKSIMAPPDPAATKLTEPEKPSKVITGAPMPEVVASAPPAAEVETDEPQPPAPQPAIVQRTEFAVDLGSANSLGGLRALWRGLLKSRSNAPLTALQPIITVREGRNGLGMQLRLVAGPLGDAAAAAKICAVMIENNRPCETTVFDGQRLAVNADEPAARAKPSAVKPAMRRRSAAKRLTITDDPPKTPDTPTLSSLFGRR